MWCGVVCFIHAGEIPGLTFSICVCSGLTLRYKISAPANQFTTTSGVTGGTQAAGAQGAMGINVLLHGDGGQSFFDFPNQAVQQNLMGVVILAPSGMCCPARQARRMNLG